jgi:hypothetical protein
VSELTSLPTPDPHPYRGLQKLIRTQQAMPPSRFAPTHRLRRNPSYGCASPLLTKTASAAVFMLQVKKLDTDETVH